MRTLRSIGELSPLPGPIHLAIGVFDGVHLGHRAVIDSAVAGARSAGASSVVLTFDPHPARILRPDRAPHLLTSTPHKERLIASLGADFLLIQKFDHAFAATDPSVFISDLTAANPGLREICVGHDWAFGKARAGDVRLLRSMGESQGFSVTAIDPIRVGGEIVSSTRIRRAVESGDLPGAAGCLGRPFGILGTVIRGRQLGRTLGFPTANLAAHNEQFPPDGVYAVSASLGGRTLDGVANIGIRPTLAGSVERTLEVHLLDFSDSIYDAEMEVSFLHHLRPEKKFDSLDALSGQIRLDVGRAREWMRGNR